MRAVVVHRAIDGSNIAGCYWRDVIPLIAPGLFIACEVIRCIGSEHYGVRENVRTEVIIRKMRRVAGTEIVHLNNKPPTRLTVCARDAKAMSPSIAGKAHAAQCPNDYLRGTSCELHTHPSGKVISDPGGREALDERNAFRE